MTNQHPITPPPELVRQWSLESQDEHQPTVAYSMVGLLAAKAARWGADQELEACCDHLRDYQWGFVDRPDGTKMHRAVDLELARRPKPPSLKEQALKALTAIEGDFNTVDDRADTIRRALEALDD